MRTIADSELADEIILTDPFPLWAQIREEGMVRTESGHIMVGRYADCTAILTDATRFGQPVYPIEGPNFAVLDPPAHGRLRGLVSQAFGPKAIANVRESARAMADGLLDRVVAQGQGDIMACLARPLPHIVIHSILGLSAEERAMWSDQWGSAVTDAFSTPALTKAQIERAAPLYARAFEANRYEVEYFRAILAGRPGGGDGLIGQLARAELDGDKLSLEELLYTLVLLLEGGENTSINLLGAMVKLLLDHPDQFRAVRDEPGLIGNAIEEILRFSPVNHVIRRQVRKDSEIGGERLREGELVVCIAAAANRDPAVFADPDRLDIRRRNANRHLSLGTGIHFCLGAWLVRAEATAALEAVIARLPELRAARDRPAIPNFCFNDRGPASVPVEWKVPEYG